MTIKELEERTGIPRANIRYYESEGLLSPARLPNGYRDYSRADVETLEKIRLLRQLHMDLDTIKAVQRGELSLERALFLQLTKLEGDQAAAQRAASVCRELEASGVEYGALDAAPWLRQLETQGQYPRIVTPAKPVPEKPWWDDLDLGTYHPWMRFLARSTDLGIYTLIIYLFTFFVLRSQALIRMGSVLHWGFNTAMIGLMLLLEPLWLHFVGYTPGKWIFGLKVRDSTGKKLTLSQAFFRAGRVFTAGYGCNIPGYGLFKKWKCYKCCTEGHPCPWDGEEGYVYLREERRWCGLLWLVIEALFCALLALGVVFTYAPVHTGALTTAEFCENFNHVQDICFDGSDRLDSAGNWIREESYGYTFDLSGMDQTKLDIAEENGAVRSVTITNTGNGLFIYQSSTVCQAVLIALEGAEKGGWPLNHRELAGQIAECWGDFETELCGIHVTQRVTHSGYDGLGQVLVAIDGEVQHYERVVTITLTGDT